MLAPRTRKPQPTTRPPRVHSSIDDFDGRIERIADSSLGSDVLGAGWMGFDLPTQSQHLYVDRAVVHLIVVYPAGLDDLVPGQHALWCRKHGREHVEFAVRQRNPLPIAPRQAPGPEIELEVAKPERPYLVLARLCRHCRLRSTENRPDAGQQLTRTERLCKIVVGAKLEPHHPVSLIAYARQHDDR